jgi:hypothetical protein
MLKIRLFAVALILVGAGMIYYGWRQSLQEGIYYPKVATFSPVMVIGGIFLLIFPSLGGAPKNNKERLIVLAVFAVGLVAGLINWYLMDPNFLSF